MDIQFNNLRQEKDYTGVIFCDQNCRLIGFGKKLDQLSKKHISSIINGDESFQNRKSKYYDYTVIHQPENLKLRKLYVFKLKKYKDYSIRDFQILGGHLQSIIKFYKEEKIIIYPDAIISSKVSFMSSVGELVLGMKLSAYEF